MAAGDRGISRDAETDKNARIVHSVYRRATAKTAINLANAAEGIV